MLLETTMLWLVGLVVLALWIPQNAQHEGAHRLAHKRFGAELGRFYVYPTNNEDQFSLRFWKAGFTWACMYYSQPADRPLTSREEAICASAPQIANTAILSFLLVVNWTVELPPAAAALAVAWYITNFVDGAVNLGTFYKWWVTDPASEGTDGWRLQQALDLNPRLCGFGAAAWHLWFGFHLFIPYSWLA